MVANHRPLTGTGRQLQRPAGGCLEGHGSGNGGVYGLGCLLPGQEHVPARGIGMADDIIP